MDQQVAKVEVLAARKAANRARYKRHFARNRPAPKSNRYPAALLLTPRQRAYTLLRGVPEYLQQVARMMFGAKGTWGHGKFQNGTKKGPGRRPLARMDRVHPAGSKLARKFIRTSGKESTFWRKRYADLTGSQYE